jgi:hypothetical protein
MSFPRARGFYHKILHKARVVMSRDSCGNAAAGGVPGWAAGAGGKGARSARGEREEAGGDDAEYFRQGV